MTRIMITGFDDKIRTEIGKELLGEENEIQYSNVDEAFEAYEQYLPDIFLLDFSKREMSVGILEKVVEFDSTACVFGSIDSKDSKITDELYKKGVRVILETPDMSEVRKFVEHLYSSCSDLNHEKCLSCWNTNRFEDLTHLN